MTTTAANLVFFTTDYANLVSYDGSCQFNHHYEEGYLVVAECCNLEDKPEAIWDNDQEWVTFDTEAALREYQEWEVEEIDIYTIDTPESVASFFLKPSPPLSSDAFNLMMGMPVDDLETAQRELTEYDRALGLC